MPNLKSAKKSMRKDKKRRARNLKIESELKTLVKKITTLIDEQKKKEASELFSTIMSKFDKAAKKNILRRENADRHKSRLSKRIAKLPK